MSLGNDDMRQILVRTDPTNEYLTRVKQKIHIMDNPKNLLEVLHARPAMVQGLTGSNTTTGPNQYRFTQSFFDREAFCIFDWKLTEFCHKTVSNLIFDMDHVMTYFGPDKCLSNQKRYINYKMVKPQKITTRQYVGLVCDRNSRMAHMISLFHDNSQLD